MSNYLEKKVEYWSQDEIKQTIEGLRRQRALYNANLLKEMKEQFPKLDYPNQLEFLKFVANYIAEATLEN